MCARGEPPVAHTHTHTMTHLVWCDCICVCVCVYMLCVSSRTALTLLCSMYTRIHFRRAGGLLCWLGLPGTLAIAPPIISRAARERSPCIVSASYYIIHTQHTHTRTQLHTNRYNAHVYIHREYVQKTADAHNNHNTFRCCCPPLLVCVRACLVQSDRVGGGR